MKSTSALLAAMAILSVEHLVFECNADISKNDARFSKLRVLLQESPDGTILVSARPTESGPIFVFQCKG